MAVYLLSGLRSQPEHSTQANDGASGSHSVRVRAPILLVEDDEDTRSLLRDLLVDEGYGVVEARNGAEALDLLISRDMPEPVLVVLDLGLPVVSGPELLAIMRSYRRLSAIPVIVASGSNLPVAVETDRGVVICLRKPFDVATFLAMVSEHAARAAAIALPPEPFMQPSGIIAIDPPNAHPPAPADRASGADEDEALGG